MDEPLQQQHVRTQPNRRLHLLCRVALLLLVCGASAATASGSAHTRCDADQFECRDGSCILQAKMCDGRRDCGDNSDELECDYKLCRKPHWFQCAQPHGPCLSAELICNGIDNCPGGEDELNCPNRRLRPGGWLFGSKSNCSRYEYMCHHDKSCIPLNFMCDGKQDCLDNSDELAGCQRAEAECTGFFCKNRKCLERKQWLCDGVDDCGDGSDENGCADFCKPEMGKFMCRSGSCIDLQLVCNGKDDCSDGSDESETCNSKPDCKARTCPPSAICHMLPTIGAECYCPKGFRYANFKNVCKDIDECQDSLDICSQICENSSGDYRCSCHAGYALAKDNRTCLAQGEEDPLLLYTTQVTVMGVNLRQKHVFTVASNLSKVIGVAYDGSFIYWTNIQNEEESIVKSYRDGRMVENLLTSGLDAPEDLAVDWLTNNIYFSDNIMRHIAVCSSDGITCVVLVTEDVHQPRSIVLWPQHGLMFWTDWGDKPMIARASMDGSHSRPIVTENIHWPNGIALDMHRDHLYWVDAKLGTVECVRTDGTDRRTVLDGMLKHPYGLAVFEDRLYWSDWGTKSIHVCNKFTGKNHQILTRDRTIYAVHIYHPSKQPKSSHACQTARCSHLCLLTENGGFTCACPDGWQLSADQLRCSKTMKKQLLFVGLRNKLLEIEHTSFGRHVVSMTYDLSYMIHEMAYNHVNGSIFIADNMLRAIVEYHFTMDKTIPLVSSNLGNVTGLAFDYLAHNLYWCDSERHVIEVYSLHSGHRAIVRFYAGIEAPIGLAVMPTDGFMYVALRARRHVHIDQLPLSGHGSQVHVFEDDIGDDDIKFAMDYETKTLFWSDSDSGRISFKDYHNFLASPFRGKLRRPYSIALVEHDLFWTEIGSPFIYWTHKTNIGPKKRFEIESSKTVGYGMLSHIPLTASLPATKEVHPCQHNNGGCSHVCVSYMHYMSACLCPAGFVYRDSNNRSCIESLDCEFRCRSGECLTLSHRCNGRKDCPDNSDEVDCDRTGHRQLKVICAMDQFSCHNGEQCVSNEQRCDGRKDCHDNSDEHHCTQFDKEKKCHSHQHACDNGECVDYSVMCDGASDCSDNSDESHCKHTLEGTAGGDSATAARSPCGKGLFQCTVGSCIASNWECDGNIDCADASDEHSKCGTRECPADMHRCLLGQCLDARLVCDGHNDCGDMTDELNCDLATGKRRPTAASNVTCPTPGQYQCSSNLKLCLDPAVICNGTAECPRGEDEADCGEMCNKYEFQCRESKQCIRMEFRCDHGKDCPDGSDELDCEHLKHGVNGSQDILATAVRACELHTFDCRDGDCLDMSRVCNDFPDCNSGIDEGTQCATACQATSSGRSICEHKCHPTPTGAICSCLDGYRLDSDLRSCVDINECTELEPCSQICTNSLGSYRCQCYPDFMLRQDRTSCKSIESAGVSMLFTSYNEVRNMTKEPVVLNVAWSANDTRINGFDVNLRRQRAYFTNDDEHVLYMVELPTRRITAGLAVYSPTKVAVDWLTDNIYVVSRASQHQIRACSFTAKMCGRILEAGSHFSIKALAVDAYHQRLFYVAIRTESFGQPLSQIHMSRLDGSKQSLLVRKSGSYVTALSTDPHKQLLYYVDLHTKTLESMSYHGSGNAKPRLLLHKSNFLTQPSGLSVYENEAYIVNIGDRNAARCQLYATRSCKTINLNILNAEDIMMDGRSRQPIPDVNPCDHAKCSGLCLQANYGYECMCGDDVVSETTRCPHSTSNEITSGSLLTRNIDYDKEALESSSSSWLVVVLLLLAFAAVVGFGYIFYQRQPRGHRDLNINLHFQNPLATLGSKSMVSAQSSISQSSSSSSGTTAASFTAERRTTTQFGMSTIQRLWRKRPTSHNEMGTEMLLETATADEVHTLGDNRTATNMSSILVADTGIDDPTARLYNGGYASDDAHARLVL